MEEFGTRFHFKCAKPPNANSKSQNISMKMKKKGKKEGKKGKKEKRKLKFLRKIVFSKF